MVEFVAALISMAICVIVIWLSCSYVCLFLEDRRRLRQSRRHSGALSSLKALIPIGFALLFMQSLAEAIHSYLRLAEGRLMPFNELLAILMLVSFFVLLLAGIPVALTLATSGLVFGYIGFGSLLFNLLPNRIFGVVTNYTLIAMPLFVFMGVMLEKSRLAEDLMEVIAHAAGNLRGGLGIGIIVVGVLMGATTGIVGATVVTLGLLTLPTLLRRGYDKGLACGIICASGTLGQIIPPSLILILLADILNESVGTLFAAAMIPGLMLAGIYVVYILGLGILRPEHGAAGAEGRARSDQPRRASGASSCASCCRRSRWSARCWARSSAALLRRPRPPRWARSAPSSSPRSAAECRGRCCARPPTPPPASPR